MGALPESVNVPYFKTTSTNKNSAEEESKSDSSTSEDDFVETAEAQLNKKGLRKSRKVVCVVGNSQQSRAVIKCAELLVSRYAHSSNFYYDIVKSNILRGFIVLHISSLSSKPLVLLLVKNWSILEMSINYQCFNE